MGLTYHDRVQAGKKRAKDSRVLIYGLARDIERKIEVTIPLVEELGECFGSYYVYVLENDSVDTTPQILRDWSKLNKRVHALSYVYNYPRMTDLSMKRIEYMSIYRNNVMNYLYFECKLTEFDYIIAIDLDLCGWHEDGVMNSLGWDNWDAIGSNGRIYNSMSSRKNVYYDIFGHKEKDEPWDNPRRNFAQLQDKYRDLKPGDDLVPVDCCFNGLAVYRSEAMLAGRYKALRGYAEHVGLHQEMIEAGYDKIFINPSQLTYYDKKVEDHYDIIIGDL